MRGSPLNPTRPTSFFTRAASWWCKGKGTQEFIEFLLEPEILKQARLGYETVLNPELLLPRIGVDESGKGDFFGPLCIAGAYINESVVKAWQDAGIRDSKNISSDKKISELAERIRKTPGCVVNTVTIGNEAYNRLYAKMKSVNAILAWGHARVIENLMGQRHQMNPVPVKAISDQFASNKEVVAKALMALGREIELVQRHRAEEDLAVAAASILARDGFVKGLAKLEKAVQCGIAEGRFQRGGRGGEEICGRARCGEFAENCQGPFPHGTARARFAGTAEKGMEEKLKMVGHSPSSYLLPQEKEQRQSGFCFTVDRPVNPVSGVLVSRRTILPLRGEGAGVRDGLILPPLPKNLSRFTSAATIK